MSGDATPTPNRISDQRDDFEACVQVRPEALIEAIRSVIQEETGAGRPAPEWLDLGITHNGFLVGHPVVCSTTVWVATYHGSSGDDWSSSLIEGRIHP